MSSKFLSKNSKALRSIQCYYQYACVNGCEWGEKCQFAHDLHVCPRGDECLYGDQCNYVHSNEKKIPCVYPGCDRMSCSSRGPYCRLCYNYLRKNNRQRKCYNDNCDNYSLSKYCLDCYNDQFSYLDKYLYYDDDNNNNKDDHKDDHKHDHKHDTPVLLLQPTPKPQIPVPSLPPQPSVSIKLKIVIYYNDNNGK